MADTRHLLVIGAGQAAQSLIESARKHGYDGAITLLGDEPTPPYQRPPLSKKYLLGEMEKERLYFRPERWFSENEVRLRTGSEAVAIDRAASRVQTADGASIPYDRLALCTGATPRRLPARIGGMLDGVHVMRTLADADALAPEMVEGRHALIVGGGYIGLEAAAVAAQRGMKVTLLEAADRILARVACRETALYFHDLHARHGVQILTGATLEKLTPGEDGRVKKAHLPSGGPGPGGVEADVVLVGIGVSPNTRLAEAAGLKVDNGIVVDGLCRTSDPAILAAGDCAAYLWRGALRRLESVQNAIDQGAVAGHAVALGVTEPGEGLEHGYRPEPWFWSDQYDVKLQIAGLGDGATHWAVRPGAREGAQSVWYYKAHDWGENLVAVDAMNDPKAYMIGKKLLSISQTPDRARISDPAVDPREIVV